MKSLFVHIILTLTLFLFPSFLFAKSGFYFGSQGGGNFLTSSYLTQHHCSFEGGYDLGIVGGYSWCRNVCLEVEATFRDNNYRLFGRDEDGDRETFHGHIDTRSFMVNGYYDFPPCFRTRIIPYVGAGIGIDHVHQKLKIDGNTYSGRHSGLSWQVIVGGNYSLCRNYSLTLEYKHHLSPIKHGHRIQNNSITVGIEKFFQ